MALSYQQLLLLSNSRHALEEHLGLACSQFELNAPDSFIDMFEEVIPNYVLPKVQENPSSFAWHTHWLIVELHSNLTIGGIGANGPADENGRVMLGYFIDKKSEGEGYATEALRCFIDWIFKDAEVNSIIADTLVDGFASQRVLQKADFVATGKSDEGLRWELKRCKTFTHSGPDTEH